MKCAIDLIVRRLTDDDRSHTLSWVMLRANQFKHVGIDVDVLHERIAPQAEYKVWEKYDRIYIYHEMAMDQFQKSNIVNVYDIGFDKSAWFFERMIWPQHDHIEFVSLDFPMLDYGNRGAYKAPRPATSQAWKDVDWKKMQERCDASTKWVLDPGIDTSTHLVLGDSHAHSAYVPGAMVRRKDARTLAGALRKGFKNDAVEAGYPFERLKRLTTYFGSIDIRHHLMREADPEQATKNLLAAYEEELKKTEVEQIEVCTPLPIEDESRKIPKMGWYKGLPFYGTQAERQKLNSIFIDGLHDMATRNKWDIWAWPDDWYKIDGKTFAKEFMERPRSVHLGWKYYRWDLKNDCPNLLHQQVIPSVNLLQF